VTEEELSTRVLLDNPEYIEILEEAVEIENSGGVGSPFNRGWNYSDVGCSPQTLTQMVQTDFVELSTRRSSRPNGYSLSDLERVEASLDKFQEKHAKDNEQDSSESDGSEPEPEIPEDLFDKIIGHEPVKKLLHRMIESDDQIHFRLQGESSTAKSVFLTELERLPGAKYRSASGMTEVGLLDILMHQQPKYLLFDEIDKAEKECYTPLYELTEHGRVQKTISGSEIDIELNCNLIVTLNHPEKLPEELRKRMVSLKFEEYTDDEYIKVVSGVLQDEYELDDEIASYIAEYHLDELGEKNVREPEQIARLAENTKEDVEQVIESIEAYR
jgi:hypothetical protein